MAVTKIKINTLVFVAFALLGIYLGYRTNPKNNTLYEFLVFKDNKTVQQAPISGFGCRCTTSRLWVGATGICNTKSQAKPIPLAKTTAPILTPGSCCKGASWDSPAINKKKLFPTLPLDPCL